MQICHNIITIVIIVVVCSPFSLFHVLCLSYKTLALCPVGANETNPVQKVPQLLSDLQAKIIEEGVSAQKVYDEFSEWCEDRSKDLQFEIKTEKGQVADLQATIEAEEAASAALETKIEELANDIAVNEADVKAATEIRDKEAAEFGAEEKELLEVISTLERAIRILEREMRKGGASMLQLKNAGNIAQALTVLVEASTLRYADATRLTALVQNSQESDDEDVNAPAATVYKNQSGNIIETLTSLLEKAEAQLADARKTETISRQNYELLKQSLDDKIRFGNKELSEAKQGLADSQGKKAAAEGELEVTSKDLNEDIQVLADLHQECMSRSEDFESETKSRGEELKALAEAKRVISESSAGAEKLTYGLNQASLLQVGRSRLSSRADLANFEAVRFVRDLAHKTNSPALAQLASRLASAVSGSADPFAKVKGLIQDMIKRLEELADAEATEKAYCDKEMAETQAKFDAKTAEIAKLTTQIDQMTARSAQLKEQVAALNQALAALAKSQAEMDKVRAEEHEAYVADKAEMEKGLEGVKLALKILREYYGNSDKDHVEAEGAGQGIIGLLEVVESDFSKGLAEMVSSERDSQASYEQETKDNEIETATKEQDVKYKSQEAKGLDKAIAEATSDRAGVQAELDAVNEYFARLKERCVAKAETYEERKRRRDAELAGLKEALTILEGGAVLLQRRSQHNFLGL